MQAAKKLNERLGWYFIVNLLVCPIYNKEKFEGDIKWGTRLDEV